MFENNRLYMFYCSLIFPDLSYAFEIWGNTNKSQLHTLMLLQKKVIRSIDIASYLDYTYPLFEQYNTLKCLHIIKLKWNNVCIQLNKTFSVTFQSGTC